MKDKELERRVNRQRKRKGFLWKIQDEVKKEHREGNTMTGFSDMLKFDVKNMIVELGEPPYYTYSSDALYIPLTPSFLIMIRNMFIIDALKTNRDKLDKEIASRYIKFIEKILIEWESRGEDRPMCIEDYIPPTEMKETIGMLKLKILNEK